MTDKFNALRRNAGITATEFADYIGMNRRYAVRIELGLEPVTSGIMDALCRMIKVSGN